MTSLPRKESPVKLTTPQRDILTAVNDATAHEQPFYHHTGKESNLLQNLEKRGLVAFVASGTYGKFYWTITDAGRRALGLAATPPAAQPSAAKMEPRETLVRSDLLTPGCKFGKYVYGKFAERGTVISVTPVGAMVDIKFDKNDDKVHVSRCPADELWYVAPGTWQLPFDDDDAMDAIEEAMFPNGAVSDNNWPNPTAADVERYEADVETLEAAPAAQRGDALTIGQRLLIEALKLDSLPSVFSAFLAIDAEENLSTLVDRGYVLHDVHLGKYCVTDEGRAAFKAGK